MSRLGPRLLLSVVLGFLVLVSASSVAQAATSPRFNAISVVFCQPSWHLQSHFPGLWFEPLWNHGTWQKPPVRKLPPSHIPEGGSTALYLSLAGLACFVAISIKKRLRAPAE